jgi:hypothetical protein
MVKKTRYLELLALRDAGKLKELEPAFCAVCGERIARYEGLKSYIYRTTCSKSCAAQKVAIRTFNVGATDDLYKPFRATYCRQNGECANYTECSNRLYAAWDYELTDGNCYLTPDIDYDGDAPIRYSRVCTLALTIVIDAAKDVIKGGRYEADSRRFFNRADLVNGWMAVAGSWIKNIPAALKNKDADLSKLRAALREYDRKKKEEFLDDD